ncbi:hypothetical protein BaRGS_00027369 [Batillaria attramentaria]|uniref:C2H2-type domain-containing protein n=1 Tax=Batillaria attramentaria TaxID=370345 RepID=A0ABD0K2Y2_9CAEN
MVVCMDSNMEENCWTSGSKLSSDHNQKKVKKRHRKALHLSDESESAAETSLETEKSSQRISSPDTIATEITNPHIIEKVGTDEITVISSRTDSHTDQSASERSQKKKKKKRKHRDSDDAEETKQETDTQLQETSDVGTDEITVISSRTDTDKSASERSQKRKKKKSKHRDNDDAEETRQETDTQLQETSDVGTDEITVISSRTDSHTDQSASERSQKKKRKHRDSEQEEVRVEPKDAAEADYVYDFNGSSPTETDTTHDDGEVTPTRPAQEIKRRKPEYETFQADENSCREEADTLDTDRGEQLHESTASERNQDDTLDDTSANVSAESNASSADSKRKGSSVCYLCNWFMSDKKVYIKHLAKVHGLLSYQCPRCNRGCSSQKQLVVHMTVACVKEKMLPPRQVCTLCPMMYTKKTDLFRHLKTQHTAGIKDSFKCTHCGKLFVRKDTMVSHQTTCLGREDRTQQEKERVLCGVCNKDFASKPSLAYHIRTIHNNVLHKCHCGKVFRWSKDFYAHRKQHAPGLSVNT